MKTPTKSISIYMSYDDISSWEYMKEILGMTTNNTLEVLLDNLVLLEDGYEYNKRRGGDLLSVKVSAQLYERIFTEAKAKDMTMSKYIRYVIIINDRLKKCYFDVNTTKKIKCELHAPSYELFTRVCELENITCSSKLETLVKNQLRISVSHINNLSYDKSEVSTYNIHMNKIVYNTIVLYSKRYHIPLSSMINNVILNYLSDRIDSRMEVTHV